MAGNIKGITIEFRGDTTKLDKALRQINKETKDIDKELRSVEKALKFNPTSVDLWRQKQTLLTQKVKETEDKLELLKKAQKDMDAKGVDKNSQEYRELQREIITTQSKLKTFKAQLKQVGNVKLKALSNSLKEVGGKLEKAGQALRGVSAAGAATTAAIGALAVKSGRAADDLNTLSKVTGIGTKRLQKYAAAADLVDVSVEAIAKSNKKLTKNAYDAANGSKTQAEAFNKLGVKVKDSNGKLRNSEDIFQDVIKALGKMTNETERDAIAQKLMGKSAAELNPLIEDGGKTYEMVAQTLKKYDLEYVDQKTLDQANAFNDTLDTLKLIGTVAIQQVGTQLAAYLAPALEKVVDWIGRFANWVSDLDPKLLTIIATIGGVAAVIAPLLITVGKMATGVSAIINLVGIVGPLIGGLAAPIGIAIAAFTAIVAAGVLVYKNWDKIKAKAVEIKNAVVQSWTSLKTSIAAIFNNIKTTITNIWTSIKTTVGNLVSGIKDKINFSGIVAKVKSSVSGVKEALTAPFNKAKDTISSAIKKIKGIFPVKLGKIFSGVKLPHFKVSGGKLPWGIGGKGKAPSISVNWYKNGGIMTRPTVFHAGGEAGDEAILPLDPFWAKMDKLIEATEANSGGITVNVYGTPGMNVEQLADAVERKLVEMQRRRSLAYGNI